MAPKPVTPELLLASDKLNRSTAEAAVAALASGGFLDEARPGVHSVLLVLGWRCMA